MKVTVNIIIDNDGKVTADVVGGKGKACIEQVLAGLEDLLGQASDTRLKPEYEWDEEVAAIFQSQEVKA